MEQKKTTKNKLKPIVVRLDSGVEIFGYGRLVGQTYHIENPLILEEQETEDGSNYVYMSRLNRYSDSRTVTMSVDRIVYVQPMSDLVREYYDKSLVFVEKGMDKTFRDGIESAIEYMDAIKEAEGNAESGENVLVIDTKSASPERMTEIQSKLVLSQLAILSKKSH